ncbi:XTP/dITP diphosphatase [Alkaliphilus transvaalensis]|uniref:XTP/dITP diphosphatase n=1 Tax=Alkaliphilus transvaalensis TaxID=114628 RepID=UPI00047CB29E|nr:XTP/dITP diphosphatase [Alkaliphilus transvaalensis]
MNTSVAIVATGNQKKLKEIAKILEDFSLEIKSMKDFGLEGLEIIEDGDTFEENAIIKARTVMEKTGQLAIADDSGLEVDYINKAPGIYSARFSGEGATDEKNNEKLLGLLEGVDLKERTGRFVCAMAAVFPNGETIVLRGECEGLIGFQLSGENGFGYDPLFIVPEYQKTFGELDSEIKNKISHRGKALEKLKVALADKLGGK